MEVGGWVWDVLHWSGWEVQVFGNVLSTEETNCLCSRSSRRPALCTNMARNCFWRATQGWGKTKKQDLLVSCLTCWRGKGASCQWADPLGRGCSWVTVGCRGETHWYSAVTELRPQSFQDVGGSVAPTSAFCPLHRGAHGWAWLGALDLQETYSWYPQISAHAQLCKLDADTLFSWMRKLSVPQYFCPPLSFICLFIIIGLCLCSSWPHPRGALYLHSGVVNSQSRAVLFQDGQLGPCEWHTPKLTVWLQDSSLLDDVLIPWDCSAAQRVNRGLPLGMRLGLTSEMCHKASKIGGRGLHKLLFLKALWMKEMCVDMVSNRKYT